MRKLLLLLPFAGLSLLSVAQSALRDSKLSLQLQDKPVVMQNTSHHQQAPAANTNYKSGGSRAGSVLNSQRIGSAGNLLTIVNQTCNQIDVNDSLNTVVFIHRNDPSQAPGTNVAQYRYDVSKNRGNSWTTNIGPITNDITIDNVSVNGRFPEGVIYAPAGTTNADSAYLVYSGTWHDGSSGSWQGSMRGRGKLSGDTSTFNVHIDVVNGGNVAIGGSMCKGVPGTFWRVHESSNNSFATGSDAITDGVIVEKGVWNGSDVVWTENKISQTFATFDNGGATFSAATSTNIAFDPTGQYGWVAVLGDITADADSVYDPIFWKTTDGGQTWSSAIRVDLDSIQGVYDELESTLINGDPIDKLATASFEADLAVDVNGNPHLLTTVGNGTQYSILASGYDVWDITFDPTAQVGCNWTGIHLADIWTLRGDMTSDATPQTQDNRPLTSRSEDGHKIFFFWNESDINIVQSSDNNIPNLFCRGIDVVAKKITPLYNVTEGDTLWGGETTNAAGGIFGGSTFPTVGTTALLNGNTYNIPLVLTQIDYNNPSIPGSSEQPAAFWYINNLDIPGSDFNAALDQVPPTVTLNGQDTVTLLVGNTYTEDSATAFDCTDGWITPVIVNSPNTNQAGAYYVLYIATDAAGNSDTATRLVIVGAPPIADFTWNFPQYSYAPKFVDGSQNVNGIPATYQWNFDDGTGSVAANPLHIYTANGTYNVCLTVTTQFGTSPQVCKDVIIGGVGIQETTFASTISLFPNPSNGKVQLTFGNNGTPDMTITVYNVLGETIVPAANYKAGTTNVELNLSGVANGLYMVKIQSANGTAVKPLTIQHGK